MLKGIAFSLLASCLFGYIYYFSVLLLPLKGEDILGYRVIFTIPFSLLAVFLFKQKYMLVSHLKRIQSNPSLILAFMLNSAIIGFEMWLFLWAPSHGYALSVSLGYLLLPLLMVLVGKLFFKEHISKLKFIAIIFATLGVAINILITGGLSWASLAVGAYAIYFVIRKWFKIADIASFAIEISLLLPLAIFFAYQVDIQQIQVVNPNILGLLLLLGLLSGTAFIFYIAASNILPINLLGLLGYVEPFMMIFVAFIVGERISTETYPLFICLLFSMLLLIFDGVINLKKANKLNKEILN
ncbi:chloramphenicol-sensitive protein RarD [Bisgaardia hudsonensis]|uniref:Chloramphenicol-sensitive protein RarD n=1 Tax=Bisgaardia hudsonensis TaxID=109472 RepID=A0A4R2MT50_9PAST|nr:EamA family transporter RarD [Bisgaardia hudsonensis]QLB12112.1 permease [Bisgaardia hudsonensis]TCP11470.1 chloramphenicol-sensitive protein RarD [Bisgaardia hudsonensis]